MKNKNIIIVFTVVFTLLLTLNTYAGSLPPGPPVTPPGVPIDGGISLLLAGLGGYAYKKFRDNKE